MFHLTRIIPALVVLVVFTFGGHNCNNFRCANGTVLLEGRIIKVGTPRRDNRGKLVKME